MASVERAAPPLHARTSAMVVLAVLGGLVAIRVAAAVLVPVLAAILFAYMLEPLVARLVACRVPRLAATLLIFSALGVLTAVAGRSLRDQIVGFADELPSTVAALTNVPGEADSTLRAPGVLDHVRGAAAEIRHAAPAPQAPAKPIIVVPRGFDVTRYFVRAAHGILVTSAQLFVVALLALLLLASGDLYKRKLVTLAGPRWSAKRLTLETIQSVDRQIERYLVVRLLISAIVAVATAIPLWALGVDRAAMWGVAAGALNVLPFAGPTLACVLIAVAALVQFHSY